MLLPPAPRAQPIVCVPVLQVSEMHAFMQKFKTAHADHNALQVCTLASRRRSSVPFSADLGGFHLQTHINLAERIALQTKSKKFDKRIDVGAAQPRLPQCSPVSYFVNPLCLPGLPGLLHA